MRVNQPGSYINIELSVPCTVIDESSRYDIFTFDKVLPLIKYRGLFPLALC